MKTVEEYLSHCYSIPEIPPALPLPAETFVASWKEAAGKEALDFLVEISGSSNVVFPLKDKDALRIFLKETLGGPLPVIVTGNHGDFLSVEAMLNGRDVLSGIPVTVNAFTLPWDGHLTATFRPNSLAWKKSCGWSILSGYGLPMNASIMKRCGCLGICRITPLTKLLRMR